MPSLWASPDPLFRKILYLSTTLKISVIIYTYVYDTVESACFGLQGSLSVKKVFETLSFLKWEFKSEWPREPNIKFCPCSTNVPRGYRQKLFHINVHVHALSSMSIYIIRSTMSGAGEHKRE